MNIHIESEALVNKYADAEKQRLIALTKMAKKVILTPTFVNQTVSDASLFQFLILKELTANQNTLVLTLG